MSTPPMAGASAEISPESTVLDAAHHSDWRPSQMVFSHPRAALVCCRLALAALAPTVLPAAAQDDKVVATINGKPITEADLTLAQTDLDPCFARLPADQRRTAALSALIEIR